MTSANQNLQFHWSVWDNNPVVSWTYDGKSACVSLTKPPLAVANLENHSLVGIVGDYDEFGSSNLALYSYDGVLRQTFVAPQLGVDARFGRVSEIPDGVSVVIGFYDKTGWVEREGKLNLVDGTIGQLHRSY